MAAGRGRDPSGAGTGGARLAYYGTDPEASAQDILEAVAGRTSLEQTFKDIKEVEGAGQQRLQPWPANLGAYCLCLWSYPAVEWWAWDKPPEQVCDRSESPWDQEERQPSHADRRKALQRECLAAEFWRRWGPAPFPEEIREVVTWLLRLAT